VLERAGTIRIIQNGELLPEPFLDLTGRVSEEAEQGFLSLAFFPDYATSGRFVVHFSDLQGNSQILLFHVSADPNRADPATETPVLSVEQPSNVHNGGQMAFGPDGMLYIGLGDGGSDNGNDEGRAQSLADLNGSVLRIDVSAGSGYSVPADNPFVGTAGARTEIWSYGLRNPWRFSFDRATGDLYVADVGQSSFEEVDVAAAAEGGGKGVNYGWRIMEGDQCVGGDQCDRTGLTLPTFQYSHQDGCSIIGGYVYRGGALPALQGAYFYGDFCAGWVHSLRYSAGTTSDVTDWPALHAAGSLTSFGEDAAGELYVLESSGRVSKIVPNP
jgi:glucose/arabinose dehydrogenase